MKKFYTPRFCMVKCTFLSEKYFLRRTNLLIRLARKNAITGRLLIMKKEGKFGHFSQKYRFYKLFSAKTYLNL